LSGVISSDAQRILYGMVNNEREYIYKNIKWFEGRVHKDSSLFFVRVIYILLYGIKTII
jgi:hypothetical protein